MLQNNTLFEALIDGLDDELQWEENSYFDQKINGCQRFLEIVFENFTISTWQLNQIKGFILNSCFCVKYPTKYRKLLKSIENEIIESLSREDVMNVSDDEDFLDESELPEGPPPKRARK